MRYKAVRGMEDILPSDIPTWQWLEHKAREELDFYGYEEIRTPVLEETVVFTRSIGETTDIVTKEMYTFQDKKGRSLTLRPEGTAPIVRAYVEHSLDRTYPRAKFYYIGPMFRSERPQKGRTRQFHQIGAEIIGTKSYLDDAEMIMQVSQMLKAFGLADFTIKLNYLGCKRDKDAFAERLRSFLDTKKNRLCGDCKERIKKNVLRVLDCKNESCVQALGEAPNVLENLCVPCKDRFARLKDTLRALHISVRETKNLVRGLDYYTGTVFEITHPALGSQDAIGAGGRYDNLVKEFGGPETGAIGYALGMERLIIALKGAKKLPQPETIFIAGIGDEAALKGWAMAEHIRTGLGRKEGMKVRVVTGAKEASLKSQLRSADRRGARLVLILGEDELKAGKITIKDMAKGTQSLSGTENILEELRERIKN